MTALPTRRCQPWKTTGVTIGRISIESSDVKTYEMSFDDQDFADEYKWSPGQFNMLYAPGVGEAAISISGGDSARNIIRHTVRRAGWVTTTLDNLNVGDQIGLRGPFGSAWPIENITGNPNSSKPDVILIGGGIGLVPLKPLLVALLKQRERLGELVVLAGSRTPNDLLFQDEYEGWKSRGTALQTTVDRTDDHWLGHVGVVTLLLERRAIPNPPSTHVMICGPDVMMRYAAECALQRGIPAENIWLSTERHMNCAVGLCGHCQIGPIFVCKDGPVFRYDEIAPWLHVQGY